LMCSTQEEG
jgi:phosphoinositide-3-kinase, regulatory subunit 4